MPVSKSEYLSWRNNEVTQMFLEDVLSECDTYIASLITNAGRDSGLDRQHVGRIEGLKTLAEWQPEYHREELNDDADS